MKPVIIYHSGCPDGWGAAWWLGRHLGEHIKHPGRYGDAPPLDLCEGAEVYVVDFCYPPDEMQQVMAASKRTTILDHHQTADEWLAGWGRTDANTAALTHGWMDAHAIVIDQQRSGCGLVADYCHSRWGTDAPRFMLNIEDRDLWRFALGDTRDVFAAVTSRPFTVEAWDAMWHEDVDASMGVSLAVALHVEGHAINRYRDQLIEQVATSPFNVKIGEFRVPCATSPYAIGSDVAGELVKRNPELIGGYVILHADHVQIGLRSAPGGPDVAELAARVAGGGGHKHAAGLKVDWDTWVSMSMQG